jgi:hypothetical protein
MAQRQLGGGAAVRGGDLEERCVHAPMGRTRPLAPIRRLRLHRGTALRCVPVLAAVALLAAACSSGPTGEVGSTLSALNGTVTLDKVLSPAPVEPGSAPVAPGQKLVAVVLTVHSPAASAAKFASIYHNSKLIDSQKAAHVGKSTTRFEVAACVAYPPFSTLGPGLAATGCDVFSIASAATPVELVISGKAKGDWKIASTAVQPGPEAAPAAPPVRTIVVTTRAGTATDGKTFYVD